MAPRQDRNQSENIRSFVLGNKELEGKTAEFQYDKGQYTITDICGEDRTVVYRSRNAQEAYTKWNVYIGRKKERPERAERSTDTAPGTERKGRGSAERSAKRSDRQERPERAERGDRQERPDRSERAQNAAARKERPARTRGSRRNQEASAEGNGGYNQGFTAQTGVTADAAEKGARRPRRRRNNRRGQESQS